MTSAPTWGETYTYDRKGNLKTKVVSSQTTTYTSNGEQQLKSVAYPGGGSTNFVWDFDGNRRRASGTGETDRYFIYDGSGVLAEYATSGGALLAAYTRGATGNVGEHQGSADYTYHTDQLGNTRFLTDSTLAVVRKYTQDAFGIETASSGTPQTPHRYVGAAGYYLHGSPGFLTLGVRQYDPRLGRFTSRDPSGPVDGPNLFAYVGSSPLVLADPTGRSAVGPTIPSISGGRASPHFRYPSEAKFQCYANATQYITEAMLALNNCATALILNWLQKEGIEIAKDVLGDIVTLSLYAGCLAGTFGLGGWLCVGVAAFHNKKWIKLGRRAYEIWGAIQKIVRQQDFGKGLVDCYFDTQNAYKSGMNALLACRIVHGTMTAEGLRQ